METRELFTFPPFSRLAKLIFSGKNESYVKRSAETFFRALLKKLPASYTLYPVIPSGYAKIKKSKAYVLPEMHAYLGFMFVKPEHRGKGINQGLTEALIEWAKSRNLKEVRLDVYADNPAAIKAYDKVGFKKNMVEMRREI